MALFTAMAGVVHAADASPVPAFPLMPSVQLMQSPRADFAGETASADARLAADWVSGSADNRRLPFVIVDKKNARVFVFGPDRKLQGSTPVLLGLAVGDGGLADMSGRPVSSLRPDERTTPAGRFAAEPGHNLQGEAIIWVDYAAKIAIHRLRPDLQQERRAQRLASTSIEDNRISMGCIVVPVAFFENVIQPLLGKSRSVVYVLPETRPLQSMLGELQASLN
ncbi:MAG: hypothetical protein V4454_21580 [Pseudomonadota bacterium]